MLGPAQASSRSSVSKVRTQEDGERDERPNTIFGRVSRRSVSSLSFVAQSPHIKNILN